MAQKRTRIIYASQSVFCNGHQLYRVQTLGSNTTFTAEDVFELGSLNRVDVVDDVPAVAVTLDTTEWGAVDTMAILAGMNPIRMQGSPTASGAYLRTNAACTGSGVRYYHGVSLPDWSLGYGVQLWAPVQEEASFGTADDNIQMTLFMDKVYVNSITLTYNATAMATENYAAETDNKMWLVNNGRFVSYEEWTIYNPSTFAAGLILGIGVSGVVPQTSQCRYAFLNWTDTGQEGIAVKTYSDKYGTIYPISTVASAGTFGFNASTNVLTLPTDAATLWPAAAKGYKFCLTYAASKYASAGTGNATLTTARYYQAATTSTGQQAPSQMYESELGGVREGQVEIYLVDPENTTDWSMSLRMQSATVTAATARTALRELGHLRPYARAMNFPVEITVNTSAFASDLERWAIAAGFTPADYVGGTGTGVNIALDNLMNKIDTILVIKVFRQTDQEAGGKNAMNRVVLLSSMNGHNYYDWDGMGVYSGAGCGSHQRERALKSIVVPGLKLVAENFQNAVGGGRGGGTNATQDMNFRAVNQLYVVKGDVHIADVNCLERNSSADQF